MTVGGKEEMKNELRIKPLLKYEVTLYDSVVGEAKDAFTAEGYAVRDGRTMFYRTGNLIREYQVPLISIIATPVDDDADIPK